MTGDLDGHVALHLADMFHGRGRQSSFHLGTHEVHRINAARLHRMSTPATFLSLIGMFQAL